MLTPSRFCRTIILGFVVCIAAIAGFVAAVDPYWLWRKHATSAYNPVLDNRMRYVKSLHVLLQRPEVVLLGSSVVYRGLDPGDAASGSVYNLGISSLRIREAEGYVRQLLRWYRPALIVLGVDYFAFDLLKKTEPGFDPGLADVEYPIKAGFSAFVSATALNDAWRMVRPAKPDDDGIWHRNGYKQTRPRTPVEIADLLKSTTSFFAATRIDEAELAALERITTLASEAGTRLVLFIPPYHRTWIDAASSASPGLGFEAWIDAIAGLAKRRGVELWDFARANPYADAPVGAASAWYLDPSHYSPLLGRWIMHRVGIPLRSRTEPPPQDFGRRAAG